MMRIKTELQKLASDYGCFLIAVACCSSKVQGRGRLTTVVVCIRGRLMFAAHWILVSSRSLDVRGRFLSLQVTGAWCEPENPTGGVKKRA